jgi:Arc/MetJ family transcription regulator
MERARASIPPDAIRIEDEVWQEAFRETTAPRSRPRLRSLDGGRAASRPAARAAARADGRGALATAAPPPSAAAELARYTPPTADEPVRRTVTITGRGAERNLPWPTDSSRRRSARRAHERAGFRPDRVAMWAVFLGVLLVLVAALSSHV